VNAVTQICHHPDDRETSDCRRPTSGAMLAIRERRVLRRSNRRSFPSTTEPSMAEVRLHVLYPHPTDVDQFEQDYAQHVVLLHEKMQIPADARPYSITRFVTTPLGPPSHHQMFTMPFPSAEALQEAMVSPAMQEVAADAVRISSGGPPVILVGAEHVME
jgi:uncharacterized protein (TIGR02118 family)